MRCEEAYDLTGTVIDGRLDPALAVAFHDHIGTCPPCRRSFELERVAKQMIATGVARQRTPSDLRRSVLAAIDEERRISEPEPSSFWSRFHDAVPSPAFVGGLAVVIVSFLLVPRGASTDDLVRHVAENDVLHQASETLQRVREGRLVPAMTTSSPEQAVGFLTAHHVPFVPSVRALTRCQSYSVIIDEYQGVPLAHVVYSIGNDLVSVTECRMQDAVDGRAVLTIPSAAREALASSGWYSDPQHTECSLVAWDENGTLCAAASTMPKEKMLALLASR